MYTAYLTIIESEIRLDKLKEACRKCEEGLKMITIGNHNYAKLLFGTNIYHMAIIKYKQKDHTLALKYFFDFFTRMNEFCKGFLDKPVYEKLVTENAFENTNDVQKCLDNSLKIFTAIYGENHSFVKSYVAENCKNRSWLYEKAKIAEYYLQYYWDCCTDFIFS